MPSARKAARVVPSPNVDNDPQRLGAKATVTPEAARRWMCQDKLERGKGLCAAELGRADSRGCNQKDVVAHKMRLEPGNRSESIWCEPVLV